MIEHASASLGQKQQSWAYSAAHASRQELHLSVLRMLQQIVSAARASGIPVAMCGEMAGDPVYTLILLALGFDELSMTAGQIPVVKGIIRKASRADAVQILEQAMSYSTAEEIERYVRVEVEKRFTMDPR